MSKQYDDRDEHVGDFMTEVNKMNAMVGGPTLGERLQHCSYISYADETLATFSVQYKGVDRPKNYSGMVTRVKSYRQDRQTWVLLKYTDGKGAHELKFPLAGFIRLTPHKNEIGGYRFRIDYNTNVLIKEEITKTETANPQEELHADQANTGAPHRPISYPPVFETGSHGMEY